MKSKNTLSLAFSPLLILAALLLAPQPGWSHCQVPCGIYDDYMRVRGMLEDAETVAKAARMIGELTGKTDPQSHQQLVRWVFNKEEHAQKIISTIADYFLTQRVKASMDDYETRLVKHHTVIVNAMEAKQQSDVAAAEKLAKSIEALLEYYPEHHHHH